MKPNFTPTRLTAFIAATSLVLLAGLAAGNILKETTKTDSWRFEQHGTAKATFMVSDDELVFDVTEIDDTIWHVQSFQTDLKLTNGEEYTVTFKAKAPAARSFVVQVGLDEEPWEMIGLNETIELETEWKDYEYKFTVDKASANNKNRFGFVLGGAKGKVHLKDIVFKSKARKEDGL